MKCKSLYLLCFLILPILLFISISAYAVSDSVETHTQTVKPKIEKYDLSHYRSLYHEKSDFNPFGDEEISRQINNVTDFFFSMTKILVGVTDYAIKNLFQLDVINDFADKIGIFISDIYEKLLSNLALTLFIVVCFNAFIIFSVQGNVREAIKRGFLIICLVGFGVGILANSGSMIRGANNFGKDLNNIIMNSTSSIDGDIDYIHGDSGINHIRNQFFDMTIYRTYLVMNYGTVNEKEIRAKGKDRIDNILQKDYTQIGEKEVDKIVDNEVKDNGINNKYMTQGYVFQKLAISVIGFIITLFMSIVFLAISFAKLIFSTFSLFLFLFLVFSWIISFIPGFELSVFTAFAKTLGYIILSACMTFLFVIVGLCIKLANIFITPESQNSYFLNCVFIILILIVLFKKRSQIINFVSRGNISFSPASIGSGVMNRTQETWNKMRRDQSQNKKQKRETQRSKPEAASSDEQHPKRNQQIESTPILNNKDGHQKTMKRRQQQETMHNGNKKENIATVSKESNDVSAPPQPQKTSQQENEVREPRQRKDIARSPQVIKTSPNNNRYHIKRMHQNNVQGFYGNDEERRKVQTLTQHHYNKTSGNDTPPITRNSQSVQRLKEQKDINKRGK